MRFFRDEMGDCESMRDLGDMIARKDYEHGSVREGARSAAIGVAVEVAGAGILILVGLGLAFLAINMV